DSPTFGQWEGFRLSADNFRQLWIPGHFAHGFYVLSAQAEMHYKAGDIYYPRGERTIHWNDPDLNIDWPIKSGEKPILSPKDLEQAVPFRDAALF
ncbi:dTDP-4-dehydrorhamnose 3,5-epimerase family protein, partial [Magnetococcales bacterium HHB-1]